MFAAMNIRHDQPNATMAPMIRPRLLGALHAIPRNTARIAKNTTTMNMGSIFCRTFKRWHRWGGGERRDGMAG
jgi:hypothetical protein